MPRLKSANLAKSRLARDIDQDQNFMYVVDSSKFPEPPFRVVVNNEIIEVGGLNREANIFTNLQRGLEGTTASFHAAGSFVENVFTAGVYEELADQEDIQQLTEEFNEHLNDDARHVTQSERDAWNSAEANAKNYTDGLIGALSSLLTNAKNTIVAAINEIVTSLNAGLNEKVSKSGDTMTGSLNTTSAFPFYIKLSGKKTWGFHRSGDNLYIAPSASNDGTDLDWSKQTVFYPDGKVSFSGIVDAKGNTSYTVRQFRNIILSTSDPNVSAMQDGDIWIKYK